MATVDFFDEDDPHDPPTSEEPRRSARAGAHHPHGGAPATRQQARVRQAGLLLGAIVLLVLIVIAFRGCLDARKARSFENYVSDLSSITAESEQLSSGFFDRLQGGGDQAGDISFESEVNGDKGTAQALLDRAEGLDAPDDVEGAQEQVELAFELRHDALEGISAQLSALSGGGRQAARAERAIYTQMKVLSASDILYARGKDQVEQALEDNDVTVDGGVPQSQFLPDEPDYLDPEVTASAFGGVAAAAGGGATASDDSCKDDGETHGLGLVDGSTLLQPSGTALANGGTVAAVAGDDEIEVAVQNQGTADESDISVEVSSDSGVSESGTIDEIAAGETQTVTVPLQPAPKAGDTVTFDVSVATVPCEQVADNNEASFTATF